MMNIKTAICFFLSLQLHVLPLRLSAARFTVEGWKVSTRHAVTISTVLTCSL